MELLVPLHIRNALVCGINGGHDSKALFSSLPKYQIFQDSPSHRIFGRMHEALNINKKIKLITQFRRNPRDESFKPN